MILIVNPLAVSSICPVQGDSQQLLSGCDVTVRPAGDSYTPEDWHWGHWGGDS